MKPSRIMVSYCIFSMLISLIVGAYADMQSAYGITAQTTVDGKDVGNTLNDLNLISGMSTFGAGLQSITNPSSPADIIGGLLSVGIGAIKTLTGVFTTPVEIGLRLVKFYFIPPVVFVFIGAVMGISFGFITLEAFTGKRF